ncbi:hypothetical protein BDSB_24625 [Burkholderia dolosa PC543]|nr:hypothetical protein BDSB_24625 [Burkholderia dolosa PC543]
MERMSASANHSPRRAQTGCALAGVESAKQCGANKT